MMCNRMMKQSPADRCTVKSWSAWKAGEAEIQLSASGMKATVWTEALFPLIFGIRHKTDMSSHMIFWVAMIYWYVIPGEKGGPAEPCSLQTIGFGEMSGAQIIDRKFSLQIDVHWRVECLKGMQKQRFSFPLEQWRPLYLYLVLFPLISGMPHKSQDSNYLCIEVARSQGGPPWAAIWFFEFPWYIIPGEKEGDATLEGGTAEPCSYRTTGLGETWGAEAPRPALSWTSLSANHNWSLTSGG